MTTATPDDRHRAMTEGRTAARRAVHALAIDSGAKIITRLPYPGALAAVRDVEPLPGLRAASQIEAGARDIARGYIRAAREAGHSWHDIGSALSLVPRDVQVAGETVAEAAYTYAAGHPGTESARRYGRSFAWNCGSCHQAISDRGLIAGPADGELGHDSRCARLAATLDAWNAEWEAEE